MGHGKASVLAVLRHRPDERVMREMVDGKEAFSLRGTGRKILATSARALIAQGLIVGEDDGLVGGCAQTYALAPPQAPVERRRAGRPRRA